MHAHLLLMLPYKKFYPCRFCCKGRKLFLYLKIDMTLGLCGVESTGYIDSSISTGSTGSYGSVNPASTGVDYYYA